MCGECLTWRSVFASNEECDRYEDEVLDPGTESIAFTLRMVERENMLDWAATFEVALREDLIGPDDFCRHSA